MSLKDFPNWHDVVARNWRKTKAYLLALGEPCVTIRDEELQAIKDNRVLVGLNASALTRWRPAGSWMLAVVLCPGDDIAPLLAWRDRHGLDPARIRFYTHVDTKIWDVLRPWHEAGLPSPVVDTDIRDWRALHERFGLDLSVRILEDHGSR